MVVVVVVVVVVVAAMPPMAVMLMLELTRISASWLQRGQFAVRRVLQGLRGDGPATHRLCLWFVAFLSGGLPPCFLGVQRLR